MNKSQEKLFWWGATLFFAGIILWTILSAINGSITKLNASIHVFGITFIEIFCVLALKSIYEDDKYEL